MKSKVASLVIGMIACGAVWGADSAPTNQISHAIARLKTAANYGWTATTVAGADAQFTPPPVKGQTDTTGFAKFSSQFGDNTAEVILKGDKAAIKGDAGWKLAVGGGNPGPEMFTLIMARNGAPGDEAGLILQGVTELKALDGGALGGDLSADAATDLLSIGPHRNGAKTNAGAPPFPGPKGTKGSAKFWIKDGALVKYQTHLIGTVTFDGNDTVLDFTRTTEIQDVGATKMDIPDEAKKQFEAPPVAK
jgi:hypothetical protein